MGALKQEQPTRSLPFPLACFLSPYHSNLVSLVLNYVCHIRLFAFALRVFSMKWSNRRSVFSLSFFHAFFGLSPPAAAAFVFALPFSKRISRNFPPKRGASFMFCGTLVPISQSRSLLISVMNVSLIVHMLKEFSRSRFSRLLSKPISFFQNLCILTRLCLSPISGVLNSPVGLFPVSSVPTAYISTSWLSMQI
jgi:hypothetical protein